MSTQSQQPDPAELALQLATGYVASSCINAVTRLGIADLLSRGPKHVAELAEATATTEDILFRVLRALATVGVFVETATRTFANTPASEVLRVNDSASVRNMIRGSYNLLYPPRC